MHVKKWESAINGFRFVSASNIIFDAGSGTLTLTLTELVDAGIGDDIVVGDFDIQGAHVHRKDNDSHRWNILFTEVVAHRFTSEAYFSWPPMEDIPNLSVANSFLVTDSEWAASIGSVAGQGLPDHYLITSTNWMIDVISRNPPQITPL